MSKNVTSFSVFHTEVNSEYWSQLGILKGNIHYLGLDVYGEEQSASNLSLFLPQPKQDRKYYTLTCSPLTTCQNWYENSYVRLLFWNCIELQGSLETRRQSR